MLRSLRPLAAAAALVLLADHALAQNESVGINTTGAAPHVSAMLDVDVSALPVKRGMLIPRMTEAERLAVATSAATAGLLVYQTNDATGRHGFWYHTGAAWARLSDGPGWRLPGNALTINGTHYLGTPDAQALVVKTNNVERMRFYAGGAFAPVYIGAPPAPAAVEALEVNGNVRLYTVTNPPMNASNAIGTIRYNTVNAAGTRAHEGNVNGLATGWQRLENAERRVIGATYTGSTIQCATGQATSTQSGNSVNWFDTPFPTGNNAPAPANPARAWRAQYLFRATELTAFGLCAGNIDTLMFFMVEDDDQTAPCQINFQIRIANTALTTFGNWDNTVSAAPVRYASCSYTVGSGVFIMPMQTSAGAPNPFNWNGTSNIIIDIRYDRGLVGFNPKCLITSGLPFVATRYGVQNFAGPVCAGNPYTLALAANSITDVPLSALTVVGTSNNRPVVRFIGQAQTAVPTPAIGNYTQYDGGLIVGTWGSAATPPVLPAGTFKGPGTIHADTAVYDGNAQLSDHVFDRYFDGQVRAEDATAAADYTYIPLRDLKGYLDRNRHLPSMPSRTEWETKGSLSLGAMATQLWETVETQALYITELERDLRVLEELAYKESMTDEELDALIAKLRNSPRLTEQQKDHLAAALRERFQDSQNR